MMTQVVQYTSCARGRALISALLVFGLFLHCQHARAQAENCPNGVLNANSYTGMRPNVQSQDASTYLAKAILYIENNDSVCKEITVDTGRYYFSTYETSTDQPKVWSYILLQPLKGQALKDVTLDFNGSELLFDNPLYAGIYVYGCASCVIENFVIDYQHLPFTQLTVTGEPTGQHPGTPETAESGSYLTPIALSEYYVNNNQKDMLVKFYGFDFRAAPSGGRLLPQYTWGRWNITEMSSDSVTVAPNEDTSSIQQGDIFELEARAGGPGVWVQNSPGATLQSLSMYTSGGPGIVSRSWTISSRRASISSRIPPPTVSSAPRRGASSSTTSAATIRFWRPKSSARRTI